MKTKVIVFDFDKTLSYSDTLFGFFSSASKKNIAYPFKVLTYVFTMVLAKFKLLSNTKLKHIGIVLFLKGMNQDQLNLAALNYSRNIKLNTLYNEFNFLSKDTIYIVSASFVDYLKPLFPNNVKVLGSQLLFKNGKIIGLKENCFKAQKTAVLLKENIEVIDVTYTDSYSDFSLASMSKKTVIVNGDKTYECENIDAFNSYFNKTQ
jgi:phosphoserine phosphatase